MSIKTPPLQYYLDLKYPVTIEEAPEGGYFAETKNLHGCFTQGETLEEVYSNMEEARRLWLESAYEDGLDIPLPMSAREYSGEFNIHIAKSLHRKLDQMADREGVSLNQYVVSTLSEAVGLEEGQRTRARKTGRRNT